MNMRAALALGIVAIVASSGSAMTKTKATNISIDGFCDEIAISVTKSTAVATAVDPEGCETVLGAGVVAKVKGFGNSANAGVIVGGDGTTQYLAQLSYPFVTGGTINLYYTLDGTTLTLAYTTTYTVDGTPARGERGTRTLSSVLHR